MITTLSLMSWIEGYRGSMCISRRITDMIEVFILISLALPSLMLSRDGSEPYHRFDTDEDIDTDITISLTETMMGLRVTIFGNREAGRAAAHWGERTYVRHA